MTTVFSVEGIASPIGIMGGTFDPIHFGHLRLAEEARQSLHLERVRLIPAGSPPHRAHPGSSAEDRLAMTRLAVAGAEYLEVDDSEVLADQPSYTIVTLERLRRELGASRAIVLLVGVDAFLGLATWFRWKELFAQAHIAVATRPGYQLATKHMSSALAEEFSARFTADRKRLADQASGLVTRFDLTPLAISATAIRTQLASRQSPRFLLPDNVLNYIQAHQLYES